MTLSIINNKQVLIWDWNGTLLDDAYFCVQCMNEVLSKRNLATIDKEIYREIFTFPVKEYYRKAGFDFSIENFEIPAMEFIDLYYKGLSAAPLYPEAVEILTHFHEKGFYQAVLSAMEHDNLVKSLKDKGIADFFDEVSGINDHYAHSKLEIGEDLVKKIDFPKESILIIGDTLHDLEVGNGLGIDVLLIANGHQSAKRLRKQTKNVIDNLDALKTLIDET